MMRWWVVIVVFAFMVTKVGSRRIFLSSNLLLLPPIHNDPLATMAMERDLMRLFDTATTMDDVFVLAEDIPAIRRADGVRKIVHANENDARLATGAMYRLANLTLTARMSESPSKANVQLVEDRRYQRLVECIELCLSNMRIADIARYLWVSSIIGATEEHVQLVFNEFSRRLVASAEGTGDIVTLEEAATMIWTCGCTKDSHGWTNPQVMSMLCDHLRSCSSSSSSNSNNHSSSPVSKASSFAALPLKLIIRVLWSLGIHGINEDDLCTDGLVAVVDEGHLDKIPSSSEVTLLWAVSQSRTIIKPDSTLRLLKHVSKRLVTVPTASPAFSSSSGTPPPTPSGPVASSNMAVSDMALFADAMVALRDTVTSSLQSREHPFVVPPLQHNGGGDERALAGDDDRGVQGEVQVNHLSNEKNNAGGIGLGGVGVGEGSPPSDDDDDVERQLQALGEALEEGMEMLVDSFVLRCSTPATTSAGTDAVLPVPILISLLRVAVSSKGSLHPQVWDIALRELHKAFASNVCISTSEAASLLEIIAFIPRTYGNGKSASSGSKILAIMSADGRLAANCASNAAQLKDKTHLINAGWALATIGYPYRKILRATRKSVQFSLHELSSSLVARLVVAVAAEEVFYTYSSPGKLRTAKFDREFVDDVALSVFRTASEMYPLHSKVNALIAVAGLGRITSFEFEIRSGHRPVTMSPQEISTLSAGLLIQLLWATMRLPDGLVCSDTIDALEMELRGRNLAPALSPPAIATSSMSMSSSETTSSTMSSGNGSGNEASLEDLKLYIRTLAEAQGTGDSKQFKEQDQLIEKLSNAILARIRSRSASSNSESMMTQLIVRQAQSIAAEVISLCEIVQSYIDLKHFDTEAEILFQEQFQAQNRKYQELATSPTSYASELCIVAYQLGRLEELLKLYVAVPQKINSDRRYDIGKKILSRLLGNF